VIALAFASDSEVGRLAYLHPVMALSFVWLLVAIGSWRLKRPYSGRALETWRWLVVVLLTFMVLFSSYEAVLMEVLMH
jgi:hypothetical protein